MKVRDALRTALDRETAGAGMHRFVAAMYPFCRSITGEGVRKTLAAVGEHIPLSVREVPSGTAVFDWTVPKEWNIQDAWVKDERGERVIDFRASNLHVVSYSVPFRGRLPLAELKKHLHSLPDRPEWVPYRTSYYNESWGFCLAHRRLEELPDGEYEVCVDSTLEDGHLSYGEYRLEGEREDEILLSCHVCHPSLCNDNLSGIAVMTFLAKVLGRCDRRYTYRFLFIPGTIGSITWLALNEVRARNVKGGLVAACLGDAGRMTYKKSRQEDAEIDRAVTHVLKHSGADHEIVDFSPYGYDERQYCSPGFDLPVGSLTRTPNGRFPEYHTSADDLGFVKPWALADSLATYIKVLAVLEGNGTFLNRKPMCEPQLGKRGLYRRIGGVGPGAPDQLALLWVLNLSDGRHSLLDIAARAGMEFGCVRDAAEVLCGAGLLEELGA